MTPASWQGWAYLCIIVAVLFSAQSICVWIGLSAFYQVAVMLGLLALVLAETLDIATRMDKDERETAHEAFAERNAAWIMVAVLGLGIVVQALSSSLEGALEIDPFLVAALIGGLIAKAVTNWYLIDK
ncbi:MAG: hypothetical protein KDK78_06490 [Chlamydiia bacterium]|nr:hypothetical protein [Chlamydiia bacterium]